LRIRVGGQEELRARVIEGARKGHPHISFIDIQEGVGKCQI